MLWIFLSIFVGFIQQKTSHHFVVIVDDNDNGNGCLQWCHKWKFYLCLWCVYVVRRVCCCGGVKNHTTSNVKYTLDVVVDKTHTHTHCFFLFKKRNCQFKTSLYFILLTMMRLCHHQMTTNTEQNIYISLVCKHFGPVKWSNCYCYCYVVKSASFPFHFG